MHLDAAQRRDEDASKRKASLQDYFADTLSIFQRARAASSAPPDFHYRIGGRQLRLRFATPALIARITPALAHLRTEAFEQASMTVYLADSLSTGVQLPAPPWNSDDYLPRGDIRGFNHGHLSAIYQMGVNALSLADLDHKEAIFWVPDAEGVPYYETAAPLRALLNRWMETHDQLLIHSAAVGFSSGGVLLVGKGGSGKSTAALSCLFSDLSYLGDDYCVLSTDPQPYAHSLYCMAKKDAEDIERLPALRQAIRNVEALEEEKAVYSLFDHFPEKLALGLPLKAILDVKIAGGANSSLMETSSSAALASLAPTTLFQLPGAGHGAFAKMAQLTRQLPCYQLSLGEDLAQVPVLISDLLAGLG